MLFTWHNRRTKFASVVSYFLGLSPSKKFFNVLLFSTRTDHQIYNVGKRSIAVNCNVSQYSIFHFFAHKQKAGTQVMCMIALSGEAVKTNSWVCWIRQ